MTLKANITSLSSGFAATQLPQTPADAVIVTRRLGFRYLWVDALCIVQNSAEDKAVEIDKMGSIYKNSALTIVASSARSAGEGFLKVRNEPDYCNLPFLLPNGKFGTAHVMRRAEHHSVTPLDSIGWTLQEWVLSPRKLCYGEKELLWYCETSHFKKVTPSPLTLMTGPLTSLHPKRSLRTLLHREQRSPECAAGIINELKSLWRDECSYGLWHESFLKLLSWYHFSNGCKSSHSNRLEIASSWSWASRTCAIVHDEVESFNLPWRLNGAELILGAKVLKYVDRLVTEFALGWAFFWDDPVHGDVRTPNAEGLKIHYLLLGSRRPHFINKVEGCKVSGLMLSLQSDSTFERVGLFMSHAFTRIFDRVQTQEVKIV
ncbi:hypothetical protein AG0111_0g11198 [Alternaria gaisen]|uniref:Uncharacterized protein n=1 Tax=Alternaria gaisen TaxID=167740 RepID=A0ACB6F7J0_9PLEO|nr:hypothetical protein AG0111_0g11198 [Alternaria gaisen]